LPHKLLKKNNTGYSFILESKSQNELTRLQEMFKNISKLDYKTKVDTQSSLLETKPRITLTDNYILIAPSTSDEKKNWTKENFKLLAEKISKQFPVYLLGTSSQSGYLSFISDGMENVNNLAGKVTLAECIYLIKHSSLFIGLDSGFTHIAELFSKPYIAIIGGGDYGRFFPYPAANADKYKFHELPCFNCKWNCIYTEPYCLNLIPVDEIYKNCISLMRTN